eukprot:jgi/Botrbrau1/12973/Bobra.154_2s0022.1
MVIREPRLFSKNRDLPRSGTGAMFTVVEILKNDKGNHRRSTLALIQTYNISLFVCVKDMIFETLGCNTAGASRLCSTYIRFYSRLRSGPQVRMGSVQRCRRGGHGFKSHSKKEAQ